RDTLSKKAEVTDAELQEAFEADYAGKTRPEYRVLEHIRVDDKASIDTIAEALKSGEDFKKLAISNAGMKENTITLGTFSKEALASAGLLPSEEVEALFTLKQGETTAPVESPLGWHIFRVKSIEKEAPYTMEGIKEELRASLKEEKLDNLLNDTVNQLEDAVAGGAKLQEAASTVGLEVDSVGPVSRDGKTPQNTDVKLPSYESFLSVAFDTGEGETSTLQQSRAEEAYYLVQVDKVIPEREKALDEVRGLVVKNWKEDQRREKLRTLASKIAGELAQDTNVTSATFAQKASSLNITVTKMQKVQRPSSVPAAVDLPYNLLEEVFTLQAGGVTKAYTDGKGAYFIAHLISTNTPKADTLENITEQMTESQYAAFGEDMLHSYLLYLQNHIPVKVRSAEVAS
ncbi:MAG: peptidyl-prolyl cis-trans isomerase, partial [Rickettsiales bacterium]|nr:peptidyl-prolyl cis-trans isomerase [Rickettsiales bacterium]